LDIVSLLISLHCFAEILSFSNSCFFFRRMFPTVRCSFLNLRPDQRYWVLLDIVPCDNKRYRYAYHRSSWLVAGKADPPPPHRLYTHPDSPFTGDQLRKQVVSFEKVKLTNNEMDKNGQVSLSLFSLQFTGYLIAFSSNDK
jgi:hypothetical protein